MGPKGNAGLCCLAGSNRSYEFLEPGETMNSTRYIEFLNGTLSRYIEQNPHFEENRPIILQDNATPHNAAITRNFITNQGWALIDHPPYSPDLNPLDYDIFNRLKRPLRGKRFNNYNEIRNATEQAIQTLNESKTIIGGTKLPQRWQEVIDSDGSYI